MWYTVQRSSGKGDIQITRAGGRRATVADAAFGLRRVKSLGNLKLVKTLKEDTAVRAVSPPSVFLYGSIRGTSLEAVGGGVLFPCRIRNLSTRGNGKGKTDEEIGEIGMCAGIVYRSGLGEYVGGGIRCCKKSINRRTVGCEKRGERH